MAHKRYLQDLVERDLGKKMVFVAGPRQVGKTTMAKDILGSQKGYLNWDLDEHREAILKRQFPISSLWVFDELHKYRQWRRYLKGIFDVREPSQRILVTGSARLDYYRYGGDSLQGRYFFWRMHPLSVAELKLTTEKELGDLLALGGFPEPYYGGSQEEARRWSRDYRSRLIRDDLRDLETVKDLGSFEHLALRLPDLVGSPLSINALRKDLQLNHRTVERWVTVLERLYSVFRISPFGGPRIRAVKKEQKHYHVDWTLVKEPGPRFENLVACHLLKWVHFRQDAHGEDVELRYFRDVDKREVDFVVVKDGKPTLCVECKWKERAANPALHYFKSRFPGCEAIQVNAVGGDEYVAADGVKVMPAAKWLGTLV